MSVSTLSGNIRGITVVSATVDLGSVAANTSETETATVPGVKVGDIVLVEKPTLEAGIVIGTAWVSAADTVSMQVINATGSAVNAASETFRFTVIRREGLEDATRVID